MDRSDGRVLAPWLMGGLILLIWVSGRRCGAYSNARDWHCHGAEAVADTCL